MRVIEVSISPKILIFPPALFEIPALLAALVDIAAALVGEE